MGQDVWKERFARVEQTLGNVHVINAPFVDSRTDQDAHAGLVAVTSSRLGHDSGLHRHVCRFLTRSLQDCHRRRATLLVASGSAIEPWALRGAELFDVPVLRVSSAPKDNLVNDASTVLVTATDGSALSLDAVVIAMADRVDAVFVRKSGTIAKCLQQRIERREDASTRVAISMTEKCAASKLISLGAVGWYGFDSLQHGVPKWNRAGRNRAQQNQTAAAHSSDLGESWIRSDGCWLVHCTRKRDGPWPGETQRQYRDSILLGADSSTQREPLDSLLRIIRSASLIAGAKATSQNYSVVCFSAVPLLELMQRRCFRPQLGRWDYEPYGIAIRLTAAKRLGVAPVIYGEPKDRTVLAIDQQYRFHPIGKTYDWREEREWRAGQSVNLNELCVDDIHVFAQDSRDSRLGLANCPWQVTFLPVIASVTKREKGV